MVDSGTEAGRVPREERLESVTAQVEAIDELIGYARTSVDVFDADLAGMGWTRPARIERLAAFLRASRKNRLHIIVHDLGYIERDCARLCGLLQLFADRMAIRRTGALGCTAMDPLLIVDGQHFLHRFHIDQPRALLGVDQPQAARPLTERFAELWIEGEPGLTGSLLGL